MWMRWRRWPGGPRVLNGCMSASGWRGRVWWWRSCRWVPSGREREGAQTVEGATELGFPGPALGKVQGEAACRAGEPSGEGEEAAPEDLDSHDLLTEADARRPAGQVVGAITWTAGQAPLAAKRPEGRWLSPTPYFRSRMAFSISAWRRWSASSSRVSPLTGVCIISE